MRPEGGKIRVAVVGCGKVSWERHQPALARLPEFQVNAVCDLDRERTKQAARLFGAKRVFTDYRELVRHDDIDAVAVLTPTAAHAEIGLAALDAGKHLFLEKPIALTLAEAAALSDAADRSGRVAQLCFNLRWHRLIRQAKELLRSEVLGRVKAIRGVYTHDRTGAGAPEWHRKLSLGGGVIFNETVHHLDLWRYLLDAEFEEVYALGMPSEHYENETTVISARLDPGVIASAVSSYRSGPNSEVEIFGDEARLLISLYRFDGLQLYSSSTYPGYTPDRLRRGLGAMAKLPQLLASVRGGGLFQETFVACWRAFGECVRNGQPPMCTLKDGYQALEAALAAMDSLSAGQPVILNSNLAGANSPGNNPFGARTMPAEAPSGHPSPP